MVKKLLLSLIFLGLANHAQAKIYVCAFQLSDSEMRRCDVDGAKSSETCEFTYKNGVAGSCFAYDSDGRHQVGCGFENASGVGKSEVKIPRIPANIALLLQRFESVGLSEEGNFLAVTFSQPGFPQMAAWCEAK